MAKKYKIKKGDQVVILTGKDKGKKGNIIDIVTKRNRVLIQGISMVKRHTKPSAASKGGIEDKESSKITEDSIITQKIISAFEGIGIKVKGVQLMAEESIRFIKK